MAESEVARLRQQIELEYQAAKRGLEGMAMVARHQFITRHMENMWNQFERLAKEVGQAEAHRIVFDEALQPASDEASQPAS
jgi:hypothetical protein